MHKCIHSFVLISLLCCVLWSINCLCVNWLLYVFCPRYELTGGSLNPARSFGPLVILWDTTLWNDHYVYWLGPLLGATIAGGLHRLILSERPLIPLYSEEHHRQSQLSEAIQ